MFGSSTAPSHMLRASALHIPNWLRWVSTAIAATVAAFALLAYVGIGIAAGDSLGTPGFDIAAAQRDVTFWLGIFVVSEAGLLVGVFSLLRFGANAEFLPRMFARSMAAILLSALATGVLSLIAVGAMRLSYR
jgi:hypothetical protein